MIWDHSQLIMGIRVRIVRTATETSGPGPPVATLDTVGKSTECTRAYIPAALGCLSLRTRSSGVQGADLLFFPCEQYSRCVCRIRLYGIWIRPIGFRDWPMMVVALAMFLCLMRDEKWSSSSARFLENAA